MSQTIDVSSTSDLEQAILQVDSATAGSYSIDFANNITLSAQLDALWVQPGVSVAIEGNGNTLDGAGQYQGLFVYSGDLSIADLTIADARAVGGAGGSGTSGGGGGGGGLGGGLFVGAPYTTADGGALAPPSSVTLTDVDFVNDSATGGAGGVTQTSNITTHGVGGGGGLDGGNGGNGGTEHHGAGGGGGVGGNGGTGFFATGPGPQSNGTPGRIPGAPSGAGTSRTRTTEPTLGGASGGGGGAGSGPAEPSGLGGGGGGGVVGGLDAEYGPPEYGGWGGGGTANADTDGFGGFGGGGGAGGGYLAGGRGGFGGGNGGGNPGNLALPGLLGVGTGGGGGAGVLTLTSGRQVDGGGGGGLGAGGDIFIEQGATLTIDGGSLGLGATQGGVGGNGAQNGDAWGSTLFLNGSAFSRGFTRESNQYVTLEAPTGQLLTVAGGVADTAGSGGTIYDGGTGGGGGLIIGSPGATGTVELTGANSFVAGITLDAGTLKLDVAGAAGSGPIVFAGDPVLEFNLGSVPANPIEDFGTGDTLQIDGFIATGSIYSGSTLTLTGAGGPVSLDIPGLDTAQLSVTNDGTDTFVNETPLCFVGGTRILTDRGEVAIEALAIGDRVITLSGAARPIRWIGWRDYAAPFARRNEALWPVRIAAGALADNVPARDLWVSFNHALFLDGVLIEAGSPEPGEPEPRGRGNPPRPYGHFEVFRRLAPA